MGNFVMALCRDLDGNVWVGTEDNGVLRGAPDGKWTQFTTKDGLGDDFGYALGCDEQGRIWVGHLHGGVSVFNGETWKNYGPLTGPLGERIFDIACHPVNGDVWMATSHGLSRYSEKDGTWSHWTREDGLPGDSISALAFHQDGTLFVGTACEGLAILAPDDSALKWTLVAGELSDAKSRQPSGDGLPSSQINDVLVARDGTVYVATSAGMAQSKNKGQSWQYLRGRNYADKAKGRTEPPPKTWGPPPKEKLATLLPEDFITCLAEDEQARLWVGFRQRGFVVIGPQPDQIVAVPPGTGDFKTDWVTAICPLPTGETWIGGYGHPPVKRAPKGDSKSAVENKPQSSETSKDFPSHPQPATPPTLADLQRLLDRFVADKLPANTASPPNWGVYSHDDWSTRGDWFGRIGNQRATLCAAGSPLDHTLGGDPEQFHIRGAIGPHGTKNEALRHWLHWRKSDERRVLHDPIIGHRREAEWDDHGETYPMTHEGPDVWVSVEVPEGLHQAGLYFVNPNGHDGANRFRDYLLELKPDAGGSVSRADKLPTLARSRVSNFWGGVHKAFLVRGPNKYWIKIDRNHSFNTIVSGVFLDRLDGPKPKHEEPPLPMMGFDWQPPLMPRYWEDEDASDNVRTIVKLKESADAARRTSPAPQRHRKLHLLCLRALLADPTTPREVIANWRWHLQLWTERDRNEFDQMMKVAWDIMCRINPGLEKMDF